MITIVPGSITNVQEFGTSTGAISATGVTGSTLYTVLWTSSAGATTITTQTSLSAKSGLRAGRYTVKVTESSSGETASFEYVVSQPLRITAGAKTHVSVYNGSDGAVGPTLVEGGFGSIAYSWTSNATDVSMNTTAGGLTNLRAGDYQITAKDQAGSEASYTYVITQPFVLTPGAVTPVTFFNQSSGAIQATTLVGGSGIYPFITWTNTGLGSTIITNKTLGAQTRLKGGIYKVTIQDSEGNTISHTYTVSQPFHIIPAQIQKVTSFGTATGSFGATVVQGGSGTYTSISWSNSSGATNISSDTTLDAKTSLKAGSYVLTVVDSAPNTVTYTYTILQPIRITAGAITNATPFGTANGIIGTSTVEGGDGDYSILWSSSVGATTITSQTLGFKSNLLAGTYSLRVSDTSKYVETHVFKVLQPIIIIPGAVQDITIRGTSTGIIEQTLVKGGSGSYLIQWVSSSGATAITDQTLKGKFRLAPGTYTITVSDADTSTGYSTSHVYTIVEPETSEPDDAVYTMLVPGGLNVTTDAVINSTLTVLKETYLQGDVGFSGDTGLGGTLHVVGNTTLDKTLNVAGKTNLSDNVIVAAGKTTSLGGTLAVLGGATLNSTLNTSGASSFASTLAVLGAASLNTLNTTGAVSLGGALAVTGSSMLNGNTSVSGSNTLTVGTGLTSLGGGLNVTGTVRTTGATPSMLLQSINIDDAVPYTSYPLAIQRSATSGTVGIGFVVSSAAGTPSASILVTRASSANTVHDLHFCTGSGQTKRMTILGTGNVGIGTDTPTSMLQVTGSSSLNILNTSTLNSASSSLDKVNISGTLNSTGAANFTTLSVTGTLNTSTLNSASSSLNKVNISGTLNSTGVANFTTLSVAGLTSLNTLNAISASFSTLNTSGTVLLSTLNVAGQSSLSSLNATVTRLTTLNTSGTLNVTGGASVSSLNASSTLNVVGGTSLDTLNLSSTLNSAGSVTLRNNLTVEGTTNLGALSFTGVLSAANGFTVSGGAAQFLGSNVYVQGNTVVQGSSTLSLYPLSIVNQNTSGNAGLSFTVNNSEVLPGASIIASRPSSATNAYRMEFNVNNGTTLSRFLTATGSGNVGLGTPAPSERLHVVGNALISNMVFATSADFGDVISRGDINLPGGASLWIGGTPGTINAADQANYVRVHSSSSGSGAFFDWSGNNMNFRNNTSTVMSLTSTGILTAGSVIVAPGYTCRSGTSGAYRTNRYNIDFISGSANLYIDSTNLGSIQSTSDYRIKKEIHPQGSKLDTLLRLRPVTFKIRDFGIFEDSDDLHHGFVAHEVQEAGIPDGANGKKDGVNADGEPEIQNINIVPILSVVTKALQELHGLVVELRDENAMLRSKVDELYADYESRKSFYA